MSHKGLEHSSTDISHRREVVLQGAPPPVPTAKKNTVKIIRDLDEMRDEIKALGRYVRSLAYHYESVVKGLQDQINDLIERIPGGVEK